MYSPYSMCVAKYKGKYRSVVGFHRNGARQVWARQVWHLFSEFVHSISDLLGIKVPKMHWTPCRLEILIQFCGYD